MIRLARAAALVFSGIILISFSGNAGKKTAGDESLVVGILTALGAALCWGISETSQDGLYHILSPRVTM